MLPYLFTIGDLRVPTHGFFVLLGTAVATVVFAREALRRREMNEQLFGVVCGTLLCGATGAKLSTLGLYVARTGDASWQGILVDGGKSILGGLAGAYVGALLFKWAVGYPRRTGDLFAPAVALGMAVGRVGCLLTEQLGTPTTLPWGIVLSPALAARTPLCPTCLPGERLHPSFVYEILFHVGMFALIWFRLRGVAPLRHELLKVYLLAYAVFRFGVEFVRGNEVVWQGLTRSQIFLVPTTLLLALYFVRRWRSGAFRPGAMIAAIPRRRHDIAMS